MPLKMAIIAPWRRCVGMKQQRGHGGCLVEQNDLPPQTLGG